jgi:hypothetical protein
MRAIDVEVASDVSIPVAGGSPREDRRLRPCIRALGSQLTAHDYKGGGWETAVWRRLPRVILDAVK